MADIKAASTPQKFTFGGLSLYGKVLSFSGRGPRRYVLHESGKRKAGIAEDMGQGSNHLTVRLQWDGPTCAADYAAVKASFEKTPIALLVHPIHGRWQAFCTGPSDDVNYSQALDLISVNVEFIETETPATTPIDTPDVGTQSQIATASLTKMQQATAVYMGAVAMSQALQNKAIAVIQSTIADVESLDAPIDTMTETLTTTSGVVSSIMGSIFAIQAKGNAFATAVQAYLDMASDVYSGSDTTATAATSDQVALLLGACQSAAQVLQDTLIATSPTPAGAAEAVGALLESLADCLVLADSIAADRPPVINWTVPALMGIMRAAQLSAPKGSTIGVEARAVAILKLNRIPNPAAIRAGVVLRVPSQ